mmetsp:Transcript_8820/g.22835  ORF Transcript_8820/g.22835 Transcript_8820/m.22835 type:complete len:1154 (-) Transcript_8820:1244-4705(-)
MSRHVARLDPPTVVHPVVGCKSLGHVLRGAALPQLEGREREVHGADLRDRASLRPDRELVDRAVEGAVRVAAPAAHLQPHRQRGVAPGAASLALGLEPPLHGHRRHHRPVHEHLDARDRVHDGQVAPGLVGRDVHARAHAPLGQHRRLLVAVDGADHVRLVGAGRRLDLVAVVGIDLLALRLAQLGQLGRVELHALQGPRDLAVALEHELEGLLVDHERLLVAAVRAIGAVLSEPQLHGEATRPAAHLLLDVAVSDAPREVRAAQPQGVAQRDDAVRRVVGERRRARPRARGHGRGRACAAARRAADDAVVPLARLVKQAASAARVHRVGEDEVLCVGGERVREALVTDDAAPPVVRRLDGGGEGGGDLLGGALARPHADLVHLAAQRVRHAAGAVGESADDHGRATWRVDVSLAVLHVERRRSVHHQQRALAVERERDVHPLADRDVPLLLGVVRADVCAGGHERGRNRGCGLHGRRVGAGGAAPAARRGRGRGGGRGGVLLGADAQVQLAAALDAELEDALERRDHTVAAVRSVRHRRGLGPHLQRAAAVLTVVPGAVCVLDLRRLDRLEVRVEAQPQLHGEPARVVERVRVGHGDVRGRLGEGALPERQPVPDGEAPVKRAREGRGGTRPERAPLVERQVAAVARAVHRHVAQALVERPVPRELGAERVLRARQHVRVVVRVEHESAEPARADLVERARDAPEAHLVERALERPVARVVVAQDQRRLRVRGRAPAAGAARHVRAHQLDAVDGEEHRMFMHVVHERNVIPHAGGRVEGGRRAHADERRVEQREDERGRAVLRVLGRRELELERAASVHDHLRQVVVAVHLVRLAVVHKPRLEGEGLGAVEVERALARDGGDPRAVVHPEERELEALGPRVARRAHRERHRRRAQPPLEGRADDGRRLLLLAVGGLGGGGAERADARGEDGPPVPLVEAVRDEQPLEPVVVLEGGRDGVQHQVADLVRGARGRPDPHLVQDARERLVGAAERAADLERALRLAQVAAAPLLVLGAQHAVHVHVRALLVKGERDVLPPADREHARRHVALVLGALAAVERVPQDHLVGGVAERERALLEEHRHRVRVLVVAQVRLEPELERALRAQLQLGALVARDHVRARVPAQRELGAAEGAQQGDALGARTARALKRRRR